MTLNSSPVGKGQVIVGWYHNAIVHETILLPDDQEERDNFGYNLVADKNNSVLLPISKRKYTVGHDLNGIKEGNPGQANAFYIYDDKYKKKEVNEINSWIYDVVEYIHGYEGEKIETFEDEVLEEIGNSTFISSGQGFQSNILIKKMIENHAMDMCKQHFEKKGYKLIDTSLNKPYDFIAKKGKKELFIEVKGTQASGEKIILGRVEVLHR